MISGWFGGMLVGSSLARSGLIGNLSWLSHMGCVVADWCSIVIEFIMSCRVFVWPNNAMCDWPRIGMNFIDQE